MAMTLWSRTMGLKITLVWKALANISGNWMCTVDKKRISLLSTQNSNACKIKELILLNINLWAFLKVKFKLF